MQRASIWLLKGFFVLLGTSAWAQPYVPGEVIVKLKSDHGSKASYAFFGKAHSDKQMVLKNAFNRMKMYHFAIKPGQKVEAAIEELRQDPNVEYAEPNWLLNKADAGGITQTLNYDDLQTLAEGDGTYMATDAPIEATGAWESLAATSYEPVVAVIDTGLDLNHSVFTESGALWVNSDEIPGNGIDDDKNGYVDDVYGWNFVDNSSQMYDDDGHGTHVSGIILGVGQDIFNKPLEPAKIRIMPLKFLDGYGVGKTSDAIKAIYYAVQNGARILNNSWGGSSYSAALHEAIAYSYDNGVSFVAAAGNSAGNNDVAPMYPASYDVPHVVSVAATTNADDLASFSNFGSESVHLGSPGVFILSTVPNDDYGYSSGTSMAAPFVSGVAALMLAEQPDMLGYQVKNIIFEESDLASKLAHKVYTESRLNVKNAVEAAKFAQVQAAQPSYSHSGVDRELASSLAGAGGCGLVQKMYSDFNNNHRKGPPSGPSTWYVLLVVALIVLPFVIANYVRNRQPEARRRHQRFKIDSDVTVEVNGRKLVGNISSISLGGVQLNTDALLEQGGLVTMNISSPDGKEQIEVAGRIVWSEAKKAYGVQFAEASDGIRSSISNWTKALSKAS